MPMWCVCSLEEGECDGLDFVLLSQFIKIVNTARRKEGKTKRLMLIANDRLNAKAVRASRYVRQCVPCLSYLWPGLKFTKEN